MPIKQRWLRDDAVTLQLQQVGGDLSMLNDCPEPDRARKWFVSLCLIRSDDGVKAWLQKDVTTAGAAYRFKPLYSWILSLKFDIERTPDHFPFSLTEREFGYYATTYFGQQIGNLQGIYHPPNFYMALAQDIGGVVVGAASAMAIPFIVPEAAGAAAFSLPVLATAAGRSGVGAAIGSAVSRELPGGSIDAAKKNMLWPRYLADYQRRLLR